MLRTSLAFSAITQRPVEVRNIRANRPKPGLRPQHLTVAKAFQEISGGSLEGAKTGSTRLHFKPGDLTPGAYTFDIGTAGSITLFLQALLPAMAATGGRWSIRVKGGTDTKWSPPWDYFNYIFLEHLSHMGMDILAKLDKRGFYPAGGGEASIVLRSTRLTPLVREERGELDIVAGKGFLSDLPLEVWERMKASILDKLIDFGSVTKEDIIVEHVLGPGDKAIGVTLWSEFQHARLGSSGLGEKGVRAEEVGERAVMPLLDDIRSGATVDIHAADQLLPYMALAPGNSAFYVREVTGHTQTNMDIISKFLDVKWEREEEEGRIGISVEGKK